VAGPTLSSTIARNSLWVGLDTGVSIVVSAVVSITAARLLGPDKLGQYHFVLWVAGLTTLLVHFGIPAATTRFAGEMVGQGKNAQALGLVRATLRLQAAFAVVIVVPALVALSLVAEPEQRLYASLVILSLVPHALMAIFTSGINATENSFHNVWPSISANAILLIGSVAALLTTGSLTFLAAALLLSRSIDAILRSWAFRHAWRQRFGELTAEAVPLHVWPQLRRFCLQAVALWLLNAIVWDRSDMLFVKLFHGSAEIAFFSLSFNLMTQALVLPQVLVHATGISMGVEQGRDPARVGAVALVAFKYLALVSMPLVWGIAALSPALVPLVYGEAYRGAVPVLAIAGAFAVARALLGPAQRALIVSDRQGTLIRIALLTGALNVALDLLFVPAHAAAGAALANGVTQAIAATAVWAVVCRNFGVRIPTAVLGRVALSALVVAGVAALIASRLAAVPALVVAPLVGVLLYGALLRWTRALDATDRGRLLPLVGLMPERLKASYAWAIRTVTRG